MKSLTLSGAGMTVETLDRASHEGWHLSLDAEGLHRMARSHALVERAITERTPVYGVTTGLGARATEVLDAEALTEFSIQTLRGRAHAIGPPMPCEAVRAGLIVRLNTMLTGHSAARPEVAQHIAGCLNAGLVPVVGSLGSIGAADLVLNATIGLALIGEGEMYALDGTAGQSIDVMRSQGITALKLAPRDGLALANHSCTVIGLAALAFSKAEKVFEAAQTAAAMSMEAFRANTGPLDREILLLSPHDAHIAAGEGLRWRLAGGALTDPDQARRLQDPLSFRNVVQIHGTVRSALDRVLNCAEAEMNSPTDNPVALADAEKIMSCGAYFSSEITSVTEALNRSFVPMAMTQLARVSKLLNPELSGLPSFLAKPNSASNGFAPVMKVAEALVAELAHAAQLTPIWPSVNANGIEDCLTNSPASVAALNKITGHLSTLAAIELIVACQAVELRETSSKLGPFLGDVKTHIRDVSPPLDVDRPLAKEIEEVTKIILELD
ncbi:aromatic amino acid lyase [uncultured Ruegeria sp.]|uniref:aromatic amino acid lyase n=1 Tax=uncultured Ruegeria sp. TaxID=259304 RepID=UPI00263A2D9D|nr:aromatic amino acid lyase [uncultured Ruegeria sp.]